MGNAAAQAAAAPTSGGSDLVQAAAPATSEEEPPRKCGLRWGRRGGSSSSSSSASMPNCEGCRPSRSSTKAFGVEEPLEQLPPRPPLSRQMAPSTPSTATPPSVGHGGLMSSFGSLATSPDACDNMSEASWPSVGYTGGDPSARAAAAAATSAVAAAAASRAVASSSSADQRLSQARQRCKDSLEALCMELKGFGGAVAVRYASWPPGARVQVALPPEEDEPAQSEPRCLDARLVRYIAADCTFEVRLRDGTTRVVPEKRVNRVINPRRNGPSPSHGPPRTFTPAVRCLEGNAGEHPARQWPHQPAPMPS